MFVPTHWRWQSFAWNNCHIGSIELWIIEIDNDRIYLKCRFEASVTFNFFESKELKIFSYSIDQHFYSQRVLSICSSCFRIYLYWANQDRIRIITKQIKNWKNNCHLQRKTKLVDSIVIDIKTATTTCNQKLIELTYQNMESLSPGITAKLTSMSIQCSRGTFFLSFILYFLWTHHTQHRLTECLRAKMCRIFWIFSLNARQKLLVLYWIALKVNMCPRISNGIHFWKNLNLMFKMQVQLRKILSILRHATVVMLWAHHKWCDTLFIVHNKRSLTDQP